MASPTLLAVALTPVAFLLVQALRCRWIHEDAFINLRVVRNLLDGFGPVYNVGERVEAATSPLWSLLLGLAGSLGIRLEHAAVYGSLALAIAGFACGLAAAWTIARPDLPLLASLRRGVLFPVGAVVFAAVPATWDYATAGLETGLGLAWLGGTYLALARLCATQERAPEGVGRRDDGQRPWLLAAVLAGLGPLVRPEFTLHSIGMLAVLGAGYVPWLERTGGRRARGLLAAAACAGALPVAYQLFRMGYYAALTPNPALAKEAFASWWDQGWKYARNFFGPYGLLAPLAAVAFFWIRAACTPLAARRRMRSAFVIAPVVCGLLHAAYNVRVGGDFMHGRLWVPVLFAVLLPVMMVPFGRGERETAEHVVQRAVLGAVVLVWALICSTSLRVGRENEWGIGDERGWLVRGSGRANPVTIEDYEGFPFHADGARLRDAARRACPGPGGSPGGAPPCRRALLVESPEYGELAPPRRERPLGSRAPAGTVLVAASGAVGMTGYLLGPDVHLVDRHGVADPVAARMELAGRGRPGHEKLLSNAWLAARFTDHAPGEDAAVSAARRALACGDLAALEAAVTGELTLGRFVDNVLGAPHFQSLRIPADPFEAEHRFCGTPRAFRRTAGGPGGNAFEWRCPDGMVVSQIAAGVAPERAAVSQLEAVCRVPCDGAGAAFRPGVPAGTHPAGQAGGSLTVLRCPAGHVATGVRGRADAWVRALELSCAPLRAGSTGAAGARSILRVDGGDERTGRPFEVACPEGQAVTGIAGRSGWLIDAVGVICGPLPACAGTPGDPAR